MNYQSKWVKLFKKVAAFFVWLFLIVVIVRFCFFDIFNVPSDSMKNTLKQKDLIITSKILYSSPLSKLLSKLNIKGHPKTNDILVFKIDMADPSFYVKRCIGLPGEIIEIDNGNVLIKNKTISGPSSICHLYKVWYQNYDILKACLSNGNIDHNDIVQKYSGYIVINLDDLQRDVLANSAGIDSISRFKRNDQNKNSISNLLMEGYGKNIMPTLIPFEGMKIKLDSNTVATYKDLLKKCEGITIEQNQGAFFINKLECAYYVFKNDYFFLMGDNRDNSLDSRTFGLIPKDYIEGKVLFKR